METLTIKSTTDYGQFKIMQGNRHADRKHIDKLKTAMLENIDSFKTKPAVVNENGYIIDGQHRWYAAKELGLPYFYVVGDKMNLGVAREMNILQKSWALIDYAQSYADGGNKNYINVLELARKYPSVNLSAIIEIAADWQGQSSEIARAFRLGEYQIPDLSAALTRMDYFAQIVNLCGYRMTSGFMRVILQLMRRDDFDIDRLINKLQQGAELQPRQQAKDNYRAIEDAYNYHMSDAGRVRLY